MLKGEKFDAFTLKPHFECPFKAFECPFRAFECPFRAFECAFKAFEQRFNAFWIEIYNKRKNNL